MRCLLAEIRVAIVTFIGVTALVGCHIDADPLLDDDKGKSDNPDGSEVVDGGDSQTADTPSNVYAGDVQALPESRSITALTKMDNCDSSTVIDRESMLAEIRQLLDVFEEEVLKIYMERRACPSSETDEDQSRCDSDGYEGVCYGPMSSIGSEMFSDGATEYSTTNLQVSGVDEADFVKNDDNTIYLVADGQLQIIDAWPPEQTHTIASVALRGTPKRLYVKGDRAVVYSSLETNSTGSGWTLLDSLRGLRALREGDYTSYLFASGNSSMEQECTYGYRCQFRGDGNDLLIQTYDISDKTKPVLIRETELGGSYVNSWRIGDIVHTVVVFTEVGSLKFNRLLEEFINNIDATCCADSAEFSCTDQDLLEMFAQLRTESEQVVNLAKASDFMPGIKDTQYRGSQVLVEEGLADTCHNIYLSSAGDGTAVVALVSFDLSEGGKLGATAIVSKPGAVYASKEALYLATRHYSSMMPKWYFDEPEINKEATTVHKFRLASGSIQTTYAGSGVVKGRLLSQFSMDENDGYLRIATTNGQVPSADVHSTLSVLQEKDGVLQVVGVVDEIAPTEDIRSVRFNGDVGFIVTFKKTDPLFVFDLSDPTNPEIKGELKVPGFATYMHLMDDTHLITMGYDAQEATTNAWGSGTFAWFQGLQLRLLDVSELDSPRVLSEVTIGTRGSSSDAATDHLAFNYFPQRDLLAIPMTLCEGGSGGPSYGDTMTFSGLLVYRVTLDDGLVLLGGVPHEEPEKRVGFSGACANWWTESSSKVKRSIFMSSDTEDFVYSVAMDLINVSNLEDLENPIASVEPYESE